jgi:hypothetical protein
MGFSSVPQEPTDQAYRLAFEFAGASGEVVLIQRAPPWSEFVPGGQISERTERLTRFERDLARDAAAWPLFRTSSGARTSPTDA